MPSSTITFEVIDPCPEGHATIVTKQGGTELGRRRVHVQSMKVNALENDVHKGLGIVALEIIKTANPGSLAELWTLINSMTITVEWP